LAVEGITIGINSSLQSLLANLSHNQGFQSPIFDLKIDLSNKKVQFDPSVASNENHSGIRDIISHIVTDIIALSTNVPRLDLTAQGPGQGAAGDYLVEIRDQFELFGSIQRISVAMDDMERSCGDFLNQYDNFSFLWEEELNVAFKSFLQSGRDIREIFEEELQKEIERENWEKEDPRIDQRKENFDRMIGKIYNGCDTKRPPLQQFDEKIISLTEIKQQIKNMETTNNVGWLKVDSAPIKIKLLTTIDQWIDKYINFLYTNFKTELVNIEKWTKEVETGISVLPTKDVAQFKKKQDKEKKILFTVMTHLRDVNQIKDLTIEQFPTMKDTLILLKKHAENFHLPDKEKEEDFNLRCDTAKITLTEVADKAMRQVKEQILPLQKMEGANIKERKAQFYARVLNFRIEFKKELPFQNEITNKEIISQAYEKIGEYYFKLQEILREAAALKE